MIQFTLHRIIMIFIASPIMRCAGSNADHDAKQCVIDRQ